MIRNVLEQIGGIGNYGLLSLGFFLACFLGLLVWALRLKRPFLKSMSQLPLENDVEPLEPTENSHE